MGLDFSHCNASWSYDGFDRFRQKLAKEVGIDLDSMEGFDIRAVLTGKISNSNKWSSLKPDDVHDFLNHSDCDGILTPEQCGRIAPRLTELIKDWDDDDYDKQQALELIEGMNAASQAGEPLKFC